MSISDETLVKILLEYGVHHPEITFLRHGENRTYKVVESSTGATYLLRIHKSLMQNMYVEQFSIHGLNCELQLLADIAERTNLISQMPIRSRGGDFVVETRYKGMPAYCSLLQWVKGRELAKEDVADREVAFKLGVEIQSLHQYFRTVSLPCLSARPQYGTEWNDRMLQNIGTGLDKGLFGIAEYELVRQSFEMINAQQKDLAPEARGIVHGDLIRSNIIVTDAREFAFIDYGLFGYGYFWLDVAMATMGVPPENREQLLEGYFGSGKLPANELSVLEGFMMESMFGFYAFQINNEQAYPWIQEHLPKFCEKHCRAFLEGRRIIDGF